MNKPRVFREINDQILKDTGENINRYFMSKNDGMKKIDLYAFKLSRIGE